MMRGYTEGSKSAIKELMADIKRQKRSVTCVAGRRGKHLKCDEMGKGPVDAPRPHGLLMKSLSGDVEKAATAIPRQYKYVRKYTDEKGRTRYVYPEDLQRQQTVLQKAYVSPTKEKLQGARLTTRRKDEMELWTKWKETGDKDSYHALISSFSPLIHKIVGTYRGRVPIPQQAMYATGETWVAKAIERYDPSKGPLHKFVQGYVNKIKSYVAKGQNFGAIPETRVYDVGNFQRAHSSLKEELAREPTIEELSAKLGWPRLKVQRLQRELIPDVAVPGETHYETEMTPSDINETIRFLRSDLSDEEKQVYDLMFTKRIFSTGDIANKLKMSPSKASKLKGSILDKIQAEAMRYD